MDNQRKLNCWEFKNCGREKNGLLSDVLGECPVAAALRLDGTNGGQAAGRACWTVSPDGCPGSGIGGQRIRCHECDFYRRVVFEEEEGVAGKFSQLPA